MTQRVSKRFVVLSIALGSLAGLPLVIIGLFSYSRRHVKAAALELIAGIILALAAYLVWMFLIRMMQKSLREKDAHPAQDTVGDTLGFLFWTTHWAYITLKRFPEDYNDYAERHQLSVPQLSPERFERWAFAALLTGCLALVVAFPGNIRMASAICDAINAIPQTQPAKQRDLHDISANFRDGG